MGIYPWKFYSCDLSRTVQENFPGQVAQTPLDQSGCAKRPRIPEWIYIYFTPCSQNTYLDTYSNFSIILFFNLLSTIIFVLMDIYAIILHWIQIRELGVSPNLIWGPDPSVLPNLVFSIVRVERFQFQTLFFNILDFS